MSNSFSPSYLCIAFFFIILATACGKDGQQPPNTTDNPSLEQSTSLQDPATAKESSQTKQLGPTRTQSLPNLSKTPTNDRDNYYTPSNPKDSNEAPSSPIQKLKKKAKSLLSFEKPTKEPKQDTHQPEIQEQAKEIKKQKKEQKAKEEAKKNKKEEKRKKKEQKAREKAKEREKKKKGGENPADNSQNGGLNKLKNLFNPKKKNKEAFV